MRIIAKHRAALRATSATLCLALVSVPADAQLRPGAEDRAATLNAERQNPDAQQPATPAQPQAPARFGEIARVHDSQEGGELGRFEHGIAPVITFRNDNNLDKRGSQLAAVATSSWDT